MGKLINTFEDIEFYNIYGQTEVTGSLTYVDKEKLIKNIDTIGLVVFKTNVKVVDKHGCAKYSQSFKIFKAYLEKIKSRKNKCSWSFLFWAMF